MPRAAPSLPYLPYSLPHRRAQNCLRVAILSLGRISNILPIDIDFVVKSSLRIIAFIAYLSTDVRFDSRIT